MRVNRFAVGVGVPLVVAVVFAWRSDVNPDGGAGEQAPTVAAGHTPTSASDVGTSVTRGNRRVAATRAALAGALLDAPSGAGWVAPVRTADGGVRLKADGRDVGVSVTAHGDVSLALGWGSGVALTTRAVGRGEDVAPVPAVAPTIDGAELVLDRGLVQERWAHQPGGVEQTWVVPVAPGGAGLLRIAVTTPVHATVEGGELHLGERLDAIGGRAPVAWDANDRPLPASYEATDDGFAVVVDDGGASYPVWVDPSYYLPTRGIGLPSTGSFDTMTDAQPLVVDLNGDGYDDLIAYSTNIYSSRSVAVNVWLGSVTGLPKQPSQLIPISFPSGQSRDWGKASSAGDVNGDGYLDLLVGAPHFAQGSGGSDEGGAYLLMGSATGLQTSGFRIFEGNASAALAGTSLSISGDLNGDGYDDVVLGAPGGRGQIFVWLGDVGGPGLLVHQVLTSSTSTFATRLASGLAVEDLDRDGYDDIFALSAPDQATATWYHFAGSATGVQPSPTAEATSADVSWNADALIRLMPAGDLDGDGGDDFLMPRRTTILGQSMSQLVKVLTGPLGPTISTVDAVVYGDDQALGISDPADVIGATPVWSWRVQASVAAKSIAIGDPAAPSSTWTLLKSDSAVIGRWAVQGDFDGDGAGDIAAAASFSGDDLRPGFALVWPHGLNPFTWTGSSAPHDPGTAAADVNGDGTTDFFAYDGATGTLTVRSGAARMSDPAVLGTFNLGVSSTICGSSVAVVPSYGDVNGDGYVDILRGDPDYTGGESAEGRAQLWLGGPGPTFTLSTFALESNQPNANLGCGVTLASDVNQDGYADAVITAPHYDVGSGEEGVAFVYFGRPSGLGASPSQTLVGPASLTLGLTVVGGIDTNRDGFGDIVLGGRSFTSAWPYFGGPTGLSTTAGQEIYSIRGRDLIAADPNGDGDVDLGFKLSTGSYEWFLSSSAGTRFRTSTSNGIPLGDLTGDGVVDGWHVRGFDARSVDNDQYYTWNAGPVALEFGGVDGFSTPIEWSSPSFCRATRLIPVPDQNADGRGDAVATINGLDYLLYGQPTGISPCEVDLDSDWVCDDDTDGDGVPNVDDPSPDDPHACGDSDGDTCDDCSSGRVDPNADGTDTEMDGLCDAGDDDDDNDTILDGDDSAPLDRTRCQDVDADLCDDCGLQQPPDPLHDGPDSDGDGECDLSDVDTDGDGVNDGQDVSPTNPNQCRDADHDGCDDCGLDGHPNPAHDGEDLDLDGACDFGDDDMDGDGVPNALDPHPYDPSGCGDGDLDDCDDCAVTTPADPLDDGADLDGDGSCDFGDQDDDGDTVTDSQDIAPRDAAVCGDRDNDHCDDCAVTHTPTPANDGVDLDGDGACDPVVTDRDGDLVPDAADPFPDDGHRCGDLDLDTCDDCTSGVPDLLHDGPDADLDGLCDAVDPVDTDVPDTDVVDTDLVDTDVPDTDVVDTDLVDTDVPDTDVVDTDLVDTDAPDTDAPDTDAPDTDAPDTDAVADTDVVVDTDTHDSGGVIVDTDLPVDSAADTADVDTDLMDTSAVDTDSPDTDVPVVPDTDSPDTDVPVVLDTDDTDPPTSGPGGTPGGTPGGPSGGSGGGSTPPKHRGCDSSSVDPAPWLGAMLAAVLVRRRRSAAR